MCHVHSEKYTEGIADVMALGCEQWEAVWLVVQPTTKWAPKTKLIQCGAITTQWFIPPRCMETIHSAPMCSKALLDMAWSGWAGQDRAAPHHGPLAGFFWCAQTDLRMIEVHTSVVKSIGLSGGKLQCVSQPLIFNIQVLERDFSQGPQSMWENP